MIIFIIGSDKYIFRRRAINITVVGKGIIFSNNTVSAANASQISLFDINGSLINTVNGSKLSTEGFSKETGAAGWRHAVVSLQQFKSAPYIQLAFFSQIAKVGNAVMIDNIKIENNPELSVDGIITEKTEEKKVYDINGIQQNAGKLHKGLYITGGKKIVIK